MERFRFFDEETNTRYPDTGIELEWRMHKLRRVSERGEKRFDSNTPVPELYEWTLDDWERSGLKDCLDKLSKGDTSDDDWREIDVGGEVWWVPQPRYFKPGRFKAFVEEVRSVVRPEHYWRLTSGGRVSSVALKRAPKQDLVPYIDGQNFVTKARAEIEAVCPHSFEWYPVKVRENWQEGLWEALPRFDVELKADHPLYDRETLGTSIEFPLLTAKPWPEWDVWVELPENVHACVIVDFGRIIVSEALQEVMSRMNKWLVFHKGPFVKRIGRHAE